MMDVVETLLLPWSHRPKGHRRGRPPNNYLRSCPRPNFSPCILRVGLYLLSISCYPHIKEAAQRLRLRRSTTARGTSVEVNNTAILHNSAGQRPDITTFGNGHLAACYSFSSSYFCNFISKTFNGSHVNVRRDICVSCFIREV